METVNNSNCYFQHFVHQKIQLFKNEEIFPEMLIYWKWEIHVMLILYLSRNHRHGGAGSLDARGCGGLFCGDYS